MTDHDPERWADDTSDAPTGMAELLRSARREAPNDAQLGRMTAALGPLLDQPVPLPVDQPVPLPEAPHAPPAAPGAGTAGIAKLAGVIVAAGLVAGGLYVGTRGDTAPPDGSRKTDEPAAVEDKPSKPEAPSAPQGEPSLNDSAAKSAEKPSDEAPADEAPADDAAGSDATRAPLTADRAAGKSAAANKPSEAQLLQQAQGALKTNPKRALALTREHRRLYPNGVLTQEREVIAIEALSRLGEDDQAKRRAGQFESKYPESAHQKKVRTTVDDDAKK